MAETVHQYSCAPLYFPVVFHLAKWGHVVWYDQWKWMMGLITATSGLAHTIALIIFHVEILWCWCSWKQRNWDGIAWCKKPGSLSSPLQFSSVAQLYLTVCDPVNHSTPGLPIHHHEFTQTHVHWVGDTIQPSHPLSSPSPPALNPSQHQTLCKWVSSLHQVAKVLEFQLQHQSFQWTPRTDLLSPLRGNLSRIVIQKGIIS